MKMCKTLCVCARDANPPNPDGIYYREEEEEKNEWFRVIMAVSSRRRAK